MLTGLSRLGGALLIAVSSGVLAQDDRPAVAEAAEEERVPEIVVIAPRPGDRRGVDDDIANDPERARILREHFDMQADREEFEWRRSREIASPSRIRVGYDPADEYELRNGVDIHALPSENIKPATLFRIRF